MATLLLLPGVAAARCADLLPSAAPAAMPVRAVQAMDLARLRQIGPSERMPGPSALAVSPDGRSVAFVIHRAEPVTNSYCVGLAVLKLAVGAKPRLLDLGGELPLAEIANRGTVWGVGLPSRVTPVWSHDGRSLAYLRRDGGRTQAWVVDVQSGAARQMSHARVDVEQVAWLEDDRGIVFAARTGRLAEDRARAAEALGGYHYDERFVPMMANVPLTDGAIALQAYVQRLAGGRAVPATREQASRLPVDTIAMLPASPGVEDGQGRRAELRPEPGDAPRNRIVVRLENGEIMPCTAATCHGRVEDIWWLPSGGTLLFLRREGWALGDTALYRWRPGHGEPRLVVRMTDLLGDCTVSGAGLACLRESATRPQRIVTIDPMTGRSRELFDTNPAFGALRLGAVRRLAWRNDRGLEVRGDLVLPPGYRGGRLPLIVTTYTSRGFLRGGFGDEYPIQVFAAHGFAVLSYQRPTSVILDARDEETEAKRTPAEARRHIWAERMSLNSAVIEGVRLTIAMGIADPARVGITGLSDGSTTAEFAMVNSGMFAAASVSTCCMEPWTINASMGPAYTKVMREDGWPPGRYGDAAFWKQGSMAMNASRIDVPLLIQQADREYLTALETYQALREHDKPVDMYVFPDEYHHKWQPAHRLAVYARNLDWFRFWLKGETDNDPAKSEQYVRWRALQATWRKGG
ncbi:Atxe2 family lasso peptide isopeptidase [Novosphingobium sp. M1R2S20]|uniref:Atxe2 family lasso peptide isopeptidase n=1 Tax=Novosphingobium rhizovicinum TaxID=3228928 RepID=A0ABV3REZ6_9SPHN